MNGEEMKMGLTRPSFGKHQKWFKKLVPYYRTLIFFLQVFFTKVVTKRGSLSKGREFPDCKTPAGVLP
ncbi:MAG: hypothetical protein MR286_06795 [Clostridiales bacterium]|nr:hypothetical protein [Clostridiales bacterium]